MPTSGQALTFRGNISSFLALLFVGSFALGAGLLIWRAAFDTNPIADSLAQMIYVDSL